MSPNCQRTWRRCPRTGFPCCLRDTVRVVARYWPGTTGAVLLAWPGGMTPCIVPVRVRNAEPPAGRPEGPPAWADGSRSGGRTPAKRAPKPPGGASRAPAPATEPNAATPPPAGEGPGGAGAGTWRAGGVGAGGGPAGGGGAAPSASGGAEAAVCAAPAPAATPGAFRFSPVPEARKEKSSPIGESPAPSAGPRLGRCSGPLPGVRPRNTRRRRRFSREDADNVELDWNAGVQRGLGTRGLWGGQRDPCLF